MAGDPSMDTNPLVVSMPLLLRGTLLCERVMTDIFRVHALDDNIVYFRVRV